MAIIPGTTRFIGISPSVDLTERRSAQINSETEPYTMADISATVGGGVATVVAGDGVSVDSTDPANPIVNAHKLFSGVFAENSGVALALSTERNDFDSTSPLIATRLGVGYYVFTFASGSFNLNSSSTVYSFQSDPNNGSVSVGFYSADTQGANQLYIFARDTTGAMADGLLDDVEFRMVQLS